MTARPLCVASLAVILCILLLTAVGILPGQDPTVSEAADVLDTGQQIWLEGVVETREEKENSVQYVIKAAEIRTEEGSKSRSAAEKKSENILNVNSKVNSKTNSKTNSNSNSNTNTNINTNINSNISSNITSGITAIPISKKILVIIQSKEHKPVSIGATVVCFGSLQSLEKPGNPGQFDSAAYYQAKGIGCRFWSQKMDVKKQAAFPVGEWMSMLRKRAATVFQNALGDRFAGVLSAMLLGEKSMLEEETKNQFLWSSLLHLLAISGLHLSMLGMGLFQILRRVRLSIPVSAVLAGISMGGYCIFTGNSVSVLRAYVMFLVMLGAWVSKRSYDLASALSLSIILLLLSNYGYLYYSGFQLSAAAVLGAGLLYPILKKSLKREKQKPVRTFWQKQKRLLADSCLACISINLTTFPLVCYYYSELPVYGIPANLLVLPTVGILLGDASVGVMVGILGGGLPGAFSKLLLLPAGILLSFYETLMGLVRLLPGAMWICGQPKLWQIVLYYGLLLLSTVWMYGRRQKLFPMLAVLAAGVLLLWRAPVSLSLTALDVGQGDSIAIQSQGHAWLVDGGSSSVKQVGKYRILPFLKSQGVQKLDGIVVTHPDEDHINGILELLEMVGKRETVLKIGQLFLPVWMKGDPSEERFLAAAFQASVPVSYLQRGDHITCGRLLVEVLHPDHQDYTRDTNEGSVTLGVHWGAFDGLLTGDLEKEGEDRVIPYLKKYEYLKCGHHGSKNASRAAFLEQVKPEIAVISCGKENRYGHPHADTLERLEQVESEIFRTDESGAVTAVVEQGKLVVKGFR